MTAPGRQRFERPYGLAWLLALAAELRIFDSTLAENLRPLEEVAVEQLADWLPKLIRPDRSGQHPNTAFALGLALDYARAAGTKVGAQAFADLLTQRARDYYEADRLAPLAYEPAGEDFLSPSLAEADLMRRVLDQTDFVSWLEGFLPDVAPLQPLASPDRSDGKLAHLDGLNLSRAWMLRGIARALPLDHPRRAQFLELSDLHAQAGLAAVTGEHYAGGHWLGTFAVYLLTTT